MILTTAKHERDTALTESVVDAMPKIELHTHLAGNVPEWLFVETARRHGIAVPENPYSFEGQLDSFLVVYEMVAESFRTPEDLYRASYESLVAEARSSGLRYREVHFSPTIGTPVSYVDAIDAIAEGMQDAKRDAGVDARIIIAIYRSQGIDVAERLVETMIAHPQPYVVGLGIEADETLGPVEWFDRTYAMAREAGYPVTAHAGERASMSEVLHAVETQGCRRIDHGYALTQDRGAAEAVRDRGVHLAATWGSAGHHHGFVRDNPIRTLLEWGLDVSISSDDPGIMKVDLRETLIDAAITMELSDEYLIAQNYAQLDAAWLPDEDKATLRAEIATALADINA